MRKSVPRQGGFALLAGLLLAGMAASRGFESGETGLRLAISPSTTATDLPASSTEARAPPTDLGSAAAGARAVGEASLSLAPTLEPRSSPPVRQARPTPASAGGPDRRLPGWERLVTLEAAFRETSRALASAVLGFPPSRSTAPPPASA